MSAFDGPRLRRPAEGETWVRRSDRGTAPVRVVVTSVDAFHVYWELAEPVWGARKYGYALERTWLSKYDFEAGAA